MPRLESVSWSDGYLGLPWSAGGRHEAGAGLDCWGLLRMVYEMELGIKLPSFVGHNPCSGKTVAAVMADNMDRWKPVDKPQPFDGVLLRKGQFACHVGVMVDRWRFLHVDEDIESCVERIDSPLWRRRALGNYRYIARA